MSGYFLMSTKWKFFNYISFYTYYKNSDYVSDLTFNINKYYSRNIPQKIKICLLSAEIKFYQ